MHRQLFYLFMLILCILWQPVLAANTPAFIVTPFTTDLTVGDNTGTNVIIAVQNNTHVNQTITTLFPEIPGGSTVKATLIDNFCGFLAPGDSCEASYELFGLANQSNANLNISVCSFNGTFCSRIQKPIQVRNAPLLEILISPVNPSVAAGTQEQFHAVGLYRGLNGVPIIQDITNYVTWNSSDKTKATISNVAGSQGLATTLSAGTTLITATVSSIIGSTTLNVTPATLTSISVTPTNPTVAKGTKKQFHAVGLYSDNTHHDLTTQATWSTGDSAIASISNTIGMKGRATGNNIGQTSIIATLGAVAGSTTINVTTATLSSISVTPTNPSSAKGTTRQFTATGIYSDNTTANLTDQVTWNTQSASIAIISNHAGQKGIALAVNIGTTAVSATLNSIIGSTDFNVTPAVLSSIDVTPKNSSVTEGETEQYTATGIYTDNSTQDITNSVSWQSSNNAIAAISNTSPTNGLATAVNTGSVTISASKSGINGDTSLTVNPATLLSIAVTPTNPTIANGYQLQFTATGTYSNTTTKDLTSLATWLSSAPSVATVSNVDGDNGLATSVSVGSTLISAFFEGINGSTTLTISPATLTSITVTPANATLPKNTIEPYTATGTYSDLSTKNITKEVTWSSTNTSVATVSNAYDTKGIATGVKNGSTTIQATLSSISGSTPATVVTLNVGDSFGGGTVACLNGELNDFIAATVDNSSGIPWGGSGTTTDAQSNTDGTANTQKIVNRLGAGTSYAAGICDAYEVDSAGNSPCVLGNTCYNDWFLPATNQLSCMRKNRNKIGGFSGVPYWSSTESSASPNLQAFYYNFINNSGSATPANKIIAYRVRCTRLISSSP